MPKPTWRKTKSPPWIVETRVVRHGDLVPLCQIARALGLSMSQIFAELTKLPKIRLHPAPLPEPKTQWIEVEDVKLLLALRTEMTVPRRIDAWASLQHERGGHIGLLDGPNHEAYKRQRLRNLKRAKEWNAALMEESKPIKKRVLKPRGKAP